MSPESCQTVCGRTPLVACWHWRQLPPWKKKSADWAAPRPALPVHRLHHCTLRHHSRHSRHMQQGFGAAACVLWPTCSAPRLVPTATLLASTVPSPPASTTAGGPACWRALLAAAWPPAASCCPSSALGCRRGCMGSKLSAAAHQAPTQRPYQAHCTASRHSGLAKPSAACPCARGHPHSAPPCLLAAPLAWAAFTANSATASPPAGALSTRSRWKAGLAVLPATTTRLAPAQQARGRSWSLPTPIQSVKARSTSRRLHAGRHPAASWLGIGASGTHPTACLLKAPTASVRRLQGQGQRPAAARRAARPEPRLHAAPRSRRGALKQPHPAGLR